MAALKATPSPVTSVCSTQTEGQYESFDPNDSQGTLKDTEWVEGASKDELHAQLLKIEIENADLQRQIKTFLKELTIANDKITVRDVEIAELKSIITSLKNAPSADGNAYSLNEKLLNQICDGIESQLAVFRQQFAIVRVKYKALEKYKKAMETKGKKKGKRGRQPRKGKAAMKVGETPGVTMSIQGMDIMGLSNEYEVQQAQKEEDVASESEQSSTSSEEY